MGGNGKQNHAADKRRQRKIAPSGAKTNTAVLSVLFCVSLLTGASLSAVGTSFEHDLSQESHDGSLWKLAEAIAAIAPFHANEVEDLLHVRLVADKRVADTYEGIREKATSDFFGIKVQRLLLKRVPGEDSPPKTILGIDVEPVCSSPDVLREHFHTDGALHVISVNRPLRTAVTFKQAWGEIAFMYKEECVIGITFTANSR